MATPPSKDKGKGGPPSKGKPRTPPKKPGSGSTQQQREPKSFSVAPLAGDNEGEKILEYAKSGTGKTTSAAQVEGAVFIPLDDGARKIRNPLTNKPVNAITGIETFDDLRDAVQQAPSLVPEGGALVIDTITKAQSLVEEWVVANCKTDKGAQVKNIEGFGFGKGWRHVLEQFRNLLTDLDKVIQSGRHVILIAQLDQVTIANPEGADYLQEVPKLIENKQGPIRTEVCEWCDQVLRVGYLNTEVQKSDDDKVGKVSGDAERAIYTGGAPHFMAKSRPVHGNRIPVIVSFEDEKDNSVWEYLLNGAEPLSEEG